MCGIVGVINRDHERSCDEQLLARMRDLMTHRGPDDAGLFVDGNVGLGHRRLSIIDLSGGRQPMTNEDGSLCIVYNGEVYNFLDLQDELAGRGHVFRSRSDTEVILHLYEEKGTDCVRHLNGMFAFAIWDRNRKRLFLARDRMGVKPLYYAVTDETFLFSSEIKSLVGTGYMDAECDDGSVFEYFVFRCLAGDRTMFKGVRCLLPGHTLLLADGEPRIARYWSPYPDKIPQDVPFDRCVEELDELLRDAVRLRLVSDVPLGAFCSGGVDSSLVTAIAAQHVGRPINTFSVGFEEEKYDETLFARAVSDRYGTVHHEIRVGNEAFASLLPEMIWHNDEPLNFANSIHIYALSRLSKEHVTVVLTGEGADELFLGYPRYRIPKIVSFLDRIPKPFKNPLKFACGLLGGHRGRKLGAHVVGTVTEAILYNAAFLGRDFMAHVLAGCSSNGHGLESRLLCIEHGEEAGLDPMTNLSLLDQQTYLVSILNRQDKMSMAASIESRVPFLDYRIVEMANRLPLSIKVRHLHGKYLVKKVAEKYLPSRNVYRRKAGFGVPLADWMREPKGLGIMLDNLINISELGEYFDKAIILRVVAEHKAVVADHSEFLWALLNFAIWKSSLRQCGRSVNTADGG